MEDSRSSNSTLSLRSLTASDSKRFGKQLAKIKHVIAPSKWASEEQLQQKRDRRRMAVLGVKQMGSGRDFLGEASDESGPETSRSSVETRTGSSGSTSSSLPEREAKLKVSLKEEMTKSKEFSIADDKEWAKAFGNIRGAAQLLVSTDNINRLGEERSRSASNLSSENRYFPAVCSKISFLDLERKKDLPQDVVIVDKKHSITEDEEKKRKSCRSASIQTEETPSENVDLPDVVNERSFSSESALDRNEKFQRTQLLESIADLTDRLERQENKLNCLKQYLDGLLLHIMDNDPSILEVSYTVRKEPVLF